MTKTSTMTTMTSMTTLATMTKRTIMITLRKPVEVKRELVREPL